MSMHDTATVSCPQCGHEGKMGIWPTLNVSLDPEQKARALDQSLFRFACKKCGHESNVHYRCLYHDMSINVMVWLVEPDAPVEELRIVEPMKMLLRSKYRLRVVRSVNELVEAIRIFDAGLNDVAVQVVKYGVAHSENAPDGPWYFNGVAEGTNAEGQPMIAFASPTADCSCQVPIGPEFDELAELAHDIQYSDSWLEITPENALQMLAEVSE